jgi:hypothetical protein
MKKQKGVANFSQFAGIPEKGGSTSMTFARLAHFGCWLALMVLCFNAVAIAQTETATISGLITDDTGAVVPGAEVKLQSVDRASVESATTNNVGIYVFASVQPGRYQLTVHKPGFKQVDFLGLIVNVQDHIEQNFRLQVGSVSESVTVSADQNNINTTDASVSTVVDQSYIQNMPLNGRSFQDLILLTPGVVTQTPQIGQISPTPGGNGLGVTGEFSVNGQRMESNYYTVDGVSANVGASAGGSNMFSGGGASGSLGASTALGTTQALVSVDDLQEFRVQSSSYSAEYGRNPGGQFSFETKSGANQWHGTAYDYLRNGYIDAKDWFNDYFDLPEPPIKQNDFGGTLGGPIRIPHLYNGRDKTFFFVSYEGLRLTAPQPASINLVPDAALRAGAPSPVNEVLNAYPVPNGPDLGNGMAEFIASWSNPSSLNSTSARFDHVVNDKFRLFFRFGDTTSNTTTRQTGANQGTPSLPETLAYTLRTYTAGVGSLLSSHLSNEFRLNYTSNEVSEDTEIGAFGGSTPVDLRQLVGIGSGSCVQFGLFIVSPGQYLTQCKHLGAQRQWNLVETLSLSLGRHQFRFGADYRRLAPFSADATSGASYFYEAASQVESNSPVYTTVSATAPGYPLYKNFSAFIQDEWKVSQRLSLSLGLRWEVNPPPGVTKGLMPYTSQGSGPDTWSLAPQGTPLWHTTWNNFAPRLGVAYVLRNAPGRETVVRSGGGVFFDTGQQLGSVAFNAAGFDAFVHNGFGSTGGPTSFPGVVMVPPIVQPPAPGSYLGINYAAHLQLPYTLQWNASIEQALGKSQALTVSYVGAHASRLLQQNLFSPANNPNASSFDYITNGLTSDYDALQIQFRRRLSRGFTALVSYSWSHCLDYGSENYNIGYQRGNCDFDVRHSFSAAFSYDLPDVGRNGFLSAMVHHWGLDDHLTARTAFPVTLNGNGLFEPNGQLYYEGLSLVPGQPVYLYGANCATVLQGLGDLSPGLGCPGGRAINPSAFVDVSSGYGDAPRNFARGFGAWQMDLAVRREFPIHESLKLQFRAEAFNIFNHPNFGSINTFCGGTPGVPGCPSPQFGQATATLASSLGVLNPLYQMGGPRSMQFALKLVF